MRRVMTITTEVSGQPIIPILKGGGGTDKLVRNVGNELPLTQESAVIIYFPVEV
jgi:hypothetical protein